MELDDLRGKIERLIEKVGYLEDVAKGSMSTREERAGTTATFRVQLDSLGRRVTNLEKADNDLNNRFFQVWIGLGFLLLGVLVDYFKR